jgi:putative AlgH/UPF0301 family transcriptional regulator
MTDGWLIAPVSNKIIFETPVNDRWKSSAELIGVDLNRVVGRQGRV